jgi:hypothetical protein
LNNVEIIKEAIDKSLLYQWRSNWCFAYKGNKSCIAKIASLFYRL